MLTAMSISMFALTSVSGSTLVDESVTPESFTARRARTMLSRSLMHRQILLHIRAPVTHWEKQSGIERYRTIWAHLLAYL